MKTNIRTKIQLKEETLNQITLTDLLDLGTKAQIAVIQLADQCMKFDNDRLRKISADVNKQVAELCNQIKGAIINKNDANTLQKTQLDKSDERPNRHGDNDMIESVQKKRKSKSIIKKLLEALDEATDDEDDSDSTDDTDTTDTEDDTTEEKVDTTTPKVIDLSSAFASVINGLDDSQFDTFKSQVVDTLKGSGVIEPAFQEKVTEIEGTENADDFNYCLDSIYDYADENNIEITTEATPTEEKEETTPITESNKNCKCIKGKTKK